MSLETASRAIHVPGLRTRRVIFFGLILGTAIAGVTAMALVLSAQGFGWPQAVVLVLFAGLFTWITNAFWNAVVGCGLLALRLDPLTLRRPATAADTSLHSRTALVMPIHNEEPERVMHGLEAVCRSLLATGKADAFEVFLLSDTTDPGIALSEERAFAALRWRLADALAIHYRRRSANTGRKPGNIAEFCAGHGDRFGFMIVLDADSIMAGATLVELVRTMEANPRAGLIQTAPMPVRQRTVFGRFFQFAAALYSPMLGASISFWSGGAANYWGHNAIVRLRPFARNCRLPLLPGRPPLGGEILSHDFVEAALMKRAGWDVWLLPGLGGSYEELPSNLLDYGKRDRRWTQGNLQHLRLLCEPGLHPMNRLHFVQGAMSYLAALLWLCLLLAATIGALVMTPESGSAMAATVAGVGSTGLARALLCATILLVLGPRLLGIGLALAQRPEAFGGRTRLLASGLLEMLFSLLIAPLLMLFHAGFVLSVLAGRNTEWEAQQREGRLITWAEAFARTRIPAGLGLGWAAGLALFAPGMLWWFAPVLPGLIAAPWLVRVTSSVELAEALRRRGWLLVPAEVEPEPVLTRVNRALRSRAHALHDAIAADQPVIKGAGDVHENEPEDCPADDSVPQEQRPG